MNRFLLFSLALVMLSASSCEDEPEVIAPAVTDNFSIRLAPTFDGEAVELYSPYINVQGHSMSFEQLRMFLSDIRLLKSDGTEQIISEVEFFDLAYFPVQTVQFESLKFFGFS